MRKLALSLLLPLLMLLSQQGAVWHEIGHLSGQLGRTQQPAGDSQKQQPVDKLCESCIAFAHLGAAAGPDAFALQLATLDHGLAIAPIVAFLAREAPARRSRGPPQLL